MQGRGEGKRQQFARVEPHVLKKPPTLAYSTKAHGHDCNGLDRYLLTRIVKKADRPPAAPVISKPEMSPSPPACGYKLQPRRLPDGPNSGTHATVL